MADPERHPFLQGLSKHRGAPPTVVVIFGASGDLTARKLIPAIYNLSYDNLLPADFHLVGYGRKAIPDEEFRSIAAAAIREFSRRELDAEVWGRVSANTTYVPGDTTRRRASTGSRPTSRRSRRAWAARSSRSSTSRRRRRCSSPIIQNLGASGLGGMYLGKPHHSKVIIEKPFGRDLDSARALNAELRSVFEESQVYRIDHYLGKETVQDLLVQRFANAIFEPLWNRNYIDSVQITVAEDQGVGTRAGYYEQSGCLRDMIQNHTTQLLALTAMEPPGSFDAEALRDEKVKVLKAIEPIGARPGGDTARAQYAAGMTGREACRVTCRRRGSPRSPPPRPTRRSASRSTTGGGRACPFYLRSGKRMPRRVSEIAIQFKCAPGHHLPAEGGFQSRGQHALVPDPARRGPRPDPQREGARPGDPDPAGEDELPLCDDVWLEHARGLRAPGPRRDDRGRHALHPRRRGGDLVEALHPRPGLLAVAGKERAWRSIRRAPGGPRGPRS